MASVPTLALTGSWKAATVLIILERVGRAIRNPARDTMLAHAAKDIGGYGWAFGMHEACDQFGAMTDSPCRGSRVGASRQLSSGICRRAGAGTHQPDLRWDSPVIYPRPQDLEQDSQAGDGRTGSPVVFWGYLLAQLWSQQGLRNTN